MAAGLKESSELLKCAAPDRVLSFQANSIKTPRIYCFLHLGALTSRQPHLEPLRSRFMLISYLLTELRSVNWEQKIWASYGYQSMINNNILYYYYTIYCMYVYKFHVYSVEQVMCQSLDVWCCSCSSFSPI